MSSTDLATELLELLNVLEQRIAAEPALAADYELQHSTFPAPAGDAHAALRFREWYLLEHSPVALGAPAVLAWSPDQPEQGSVWEALIGARFGILRPVESAEAGVFEDLWTGRRVELAAAPEAPGQELLMVGWFAPLGEDIELPLPGARALAIPGLEQAMVRDLAQARIENPRGRLSHLACEQMLLAVAHADAPEGYPKDAVREVDLEAELSVLLVDTPEWSVDRALQLLATEGDNALLDRLAFDTDVDLEALRRLLLEHRESMQAAESDSDDAQDLLDAAAAGEVDPETVAAALEAFDASAGDSSVAERFAALEEALGLEAGVTEEGAPLDSEEAESLGPGALPGLPFWIASWAWEMEQAGTAPVESELKTLAAWTDFLAASREDKVDAAELGRADLTAFLMASGTPAELQLRREGIARFLEWLEVEQLAPVEGMAAELTGELGDRLAAAVEANAELAQSAVRADATTVLTSVGPPAVEAEDGQRVEVEGMPDAARAHCRVGDRVLGHWAAGHFQVAAWMPQDLLPTAAQADA